MNFSNYIQLLTRRWKETLAITIITVLCIYGFLVIKNKTPYLTTVFISIGAKQPANTTANPSSIYENLQAADAFTESVQGWFKDPAFIKQITQNKTAFDVKKQEKQNIVVTYETQNTTDSDTINEKLKTELISNFTTYNKNTNSDFQMAIYSPLTDKKDINLGLFLLLGLILGFILGSIFSYTYELIFGFASFEEQVTNSLGKNSIEKLTTLQSDVSLLATFIKKSGHKKILLAGINTNPHNLMEELKRKLQDVNFESANLPRESEKLIHSEYALLACALGKSNLEDLKKLNTILPKNFDFIIIER